MTKSLDSASLYPILSLVDSFPRVVADGMSSSSLCDKLVDECIPQNMLCLDAKSAYDVERKYSVINCPVVNPTTFKNIKI
ncbi:21852_t:CDS:2 [Cetraspora pellucida]|uniref:21852_t:CDS:1 n=1 Tax=Cetraspora pellucida TaxID=1433469 RepID=A0A9N9EE51_9GLOM|nr:21852_t:CDS:2 [Cetraspora pellucida]